MSNGMHSLILIRISTKSASSCLRDCIFQNPEMARRNMDFSFESSTIVVETDPKHTLKET